MKKIISLALTLALLLAMTACGGSSGSSSVPSPGEPGESGEPAPGPEAGPVTILIPISPLRVPMTAPVSSRPRSRKGWRLIFSFPPPRSR